MTRTLFTALAAGTLATACTLDAGQGFATLKEGELHMALELSEARELEGGAFMTDLGYRIAPRELTVRAGHVMLLTQRAEGASTDAEPSLCHGDHCHGEDGSLIEEEHASEEEGAAQYAPIVEAHLDRELDLLEGEHAALTAFEPSAELPEGTLDRLEIELVELRIRADIEGGELSEPAQLEVDLPLGVALRKAVSLAIDRDGPEEVQLDVTVHFDASALDGIDFASQASDGTLAIDEDAPESEALLAWLARAEIEVTFDGSEGSGHEGHDHD